LNLQHGPSRSTSWRNYQIELYSGKIRGAKIESFTGFLGPVVLLFHSVAYMAISMLF